MNLHCKSCGKIRVTISQKGKKHVVRRHYLSRGADEVSLFYNTYRPSFFFEAVVNELRTGLKLKGTIDGDSLTFIFEFHFTVGTSRDRYPTGYVKVVCTTKKCPHTDYRRFLPKGIITMYPI